MPITTREARQLITASERSLFESSLPTALRALSPFRLKGKMARARALRDKYRDQAKRQRRQGKPARSGRPAEAFVSRPTRKAELFADVLARFTDESRRRAAAHDSRGAKARPASRRKTTAKKPASRRQTTAKNKTTAKKVSPTPPAQTVAPAARPAPAAGPAPAPPLKVKKTLEPLVPKSAVMARAGKDRMHAHVSSQGRRNQGRRDNR